MAANANQAPVQGPGPAAFGSAWLREAITWPVPEVVASTGSTNADLLAAAAAGAPHGSVLVAAQQSAGRGRLGRVWASPPGSSVSVSVLLRPPAAVRAGSGWLPLMTGLSVRAAVAALGLDAVLKWPNDVLVASGPRPGKIAGILAEADGGALHPYVVVGFGVNTEMPAERMPVPEATSLLACGEPGADVPALVAAAVAGLQRRYDGWLAAAGDAARCGLWQEYRDACATVGATVAVKLPGGRESVGLVAGIGPGGELLLQTGAGLEAVTSGDVVQVR